MLFKKFGAALSLCFLVCAGLPAQVTYVDADVTSNTTLADGTPLVDGVHFATDSVASDGLWNLRAFANGGTVLGANDGGGNEDVMRLRTTVTGLAAGESYEVFGYFWGAVNSQWRGRISLTDDQPDIAGFNTFHTDSSAFSAMTFVTRHYSNSELNPGPLSTDDGTGVVDETSFENGGYFTNSVMVAEGNRSLYEVSLGIVEADANGELAVFVDDLANTTNVNRTWYDGVGYSLAGGGSGDFVPPASFTNFRGVVLSAGLADFGTSDDVRATYNPGFVLNDTEAPVWLIFDANAPSAVEILLESNAGTPGLSHTVEAWNFNTSSFDELAVTSEGFNVDGVFTFPIVAADHIDQNGDVQSRIGWRQTGFIINFPWEVRVDQAGWNQN